MKRVKSSVHASVLSVPLCTVTVQETRGHDGKYMLLCHVWKRKYNAINAFYNL
jgi:hypothetical protein